MSKPYNSFLYEKYHSTHVVPRDGEFEELRLQHEAKIWERLFSRYLPANKKARILDLGCGSGSILGWLQSKGYDDAGGIDLSPEEVETARRMKVRNVVVGSIDQILKDSGEDCYDFIIMRDVLEHMPKQLAFDTLRMIHHGLKPGGRLLLQLPNGASPFVGRTLYGDFTHEWIYTTLSLSQLAHAIGYQVVAFAPYHPCSRSLTSRGRRALLQLIETFLGWYVRLEMGDRRPIMSQVLVAVLEKKGAA